MGKLIENPQGARGKSIARFHAGVGNHLKSQGQQGVPGKDRRCLTKNHVRSGLAATQVVIVERRQIIVNQRVRVDQFERATHPQQNRLITAEQTPSLQT